MTTFEELSFENKIKGYELLLSTITSTSLIELQAKAFEYLNDTSNEKQEMDISLFTKKSNYTLDQFNADFWEIFRELWNADDLTETYNDFINKYDRDIKVYMEALCNGYDGERVRALLETHGLL